MLKASSLARHHPRNHGLLAPNASLRAAVTARAGLPAERPVHDTPLQRLPKRHPSGQGDSTGTGGLASRRARACQLSSGVLEGFNTKAKLTTRKAFGFRTYHASEVALYHTLGALPEPEFAHKFR